MPETNRFSRKLKATRRSKSRHLARRRLCLESLEDRRLLAAIPVLNSFPSASATLYLDFDGHFEATWGSFSNVTTPALNFDGDPNSINGAEDQYIRDVWAIVAEDYAPFKINVTTVEPAVLAEGVPSSVANGVALRVAIGGSAAVLNQSDSALGYGFYNSFTSSVANVALAFPERRAGLIAPR